MSQNAEIEGMAGDGFWGCCSENRTSEPHLPTCKFTTPRADIEGKDERIILVHEQGSDSVTVERQTWGRSDGVPTYYVRLAPHNVLDAGYDEAVVRLDQRSIDRLRHWLLTGEALARGVEVPDPIGAAEKAPHEADAFPRCPGCGSVVSERVQSCLPVGVDTTKPGYQYLADTWGYCLHLGRHIGTDEPRYRPGAESSDG